MKILQTVGALLVMSIQAMEQPVPVAPQYTFIGNDGGQVQIAQNLIKKYAPGLALKFSAGFKETQTGQLILQDLDGAALQNFKVLFEQAAELSQINEKQYAEITKEKEKALEKASLVEGLGGQEFELRKNILSEGAARSQVIRNRSIERLKATIEQLPSIGDHFLELFNHAVLWEVPHILQEALAQFAAEHLPHSDPNAFTSLRNPEFAIHAQLLYLNHVRFDVDSIVKVYEWLIDLINNPETKIINPEIKIIKLNKELLNLLIDRLAAFSAENIINIMERVPNFKTLIASGNIKAFRELLKEKLIAHGDRYFKKNLFRGGLEVTFLVPFLIDNDHLGLLEVPKGTSSQMKLMIFEVRTKLFKTIYINEPMKVLRPSKVVSFGPNRFIMFYPSEPGQEKKRMDIFDVTTGKIFLTHMFKKWIGIIDVQVIDETHLLITSIDKRLGIYDLRVPVEEPEILKQFTFSLSSFVVDSTHIVTCKDESISLWNPQTFLKKKLPLILYPKEYKEPKEEYKVWNMRNNFKKIVRRDENDILLIGDRAINFNLRTQQITPIDLPRDTVDVLSPRYYLVQNEDINPGLLKIWDNQERRFVRQFENVATFLKIDKNHIAILSEKGELDIYFLPEASTLDEILDELQKQFPVVAQTLPAASIKREPEEELPAEQVKKSKKEDPTQKR